MIDYAYLVAEAKEARKKAYAPYSTFQVGASVLARGDKIYTGCNIENSSYGVSRCAEQVAILKAVAAGEREILALAVVGGYEDELVLTTPCGVCRQMLVEFAKPATPIILGLQEGYELKLLEDLLPLAFDKETLT